MDTTILLEGYKELNNGNFENLGDLFIKVVQTPNWAALQEKFNSCNDIYVLGHGGNLSGRRPCCC